MLESVAVVLKKYSQTRVRVEGHTDATGGAQYNLGLSMRRAQNVANQLVAFEIPSSRLDVKGFGETAPVASNKTKAG